LSIPTAVEGVPDDILHPRKAWQGVPDDFQTSLNSVADMFVKNFKTFQDEASPETCNAGPRI
jgi:phosphoenolpyruvate carboxykinase (ATP)